MSHPVLQHFHCLSEAMEVIFLWCSFLKFRPSLPHNLDYLDYVQPHFIRNFHHDGYLTDFPSSQYMTKGRFIVGSLAQIEIDTKMFGPFNIPLLECLRRRVKTQACKIGIAWRERLSNTHLARTPGRPPENEERDMPVLSKQDFRHDSYLTDSWPSRYMTQSLIIVESHVKIEIHTWLN